MTQVSYINKINKQINKLKEQSRKYRDEAKKHQKEMQKIIKRVETSLDMNYRKKAAGEIQQRVQKIQIAAQRQVAADYAVKQLEEQLKSIKSGGLVFG